MYHCHKKCRREFCSLFRFFMNQHFHLFSWRHSSSSDGCDQSIVIWLQQQDNLDNASQTLENVSQNLGDASQTLENASK